MNLLERCGIRCRICGVWFWQHHRSIALDAAALNTPLAVLIPNEADYDAVIEHDRKHAIRGMPAVIQRIASKSEDVAVKKWEDRRGLK